MKLLTLAVMGVLLSGVANAATVTATIDAFRLSIKHDGIRQSAGDETLTYSSQWDGGDGATVTIAQDGAAVVEGLTGEGERAWSVTRNGTYVLTHTTYTNGVAGKVETATFVVTGKDVPFAEGDVTVSGYEAKYDGAAHGIGVTVADGIAGVSLRYASGALGESALPGAFSTEPPTLTDVGSMTVWCEIAAPGHITQTNSATVTITKRAVTLTSGDASKVYDGTALVKHEVAVSGDGFVTGEGASYNFTGSQTDVGTSENTFTYTLNEGTKAGNYDITTVNGTLTVTKATVGPGGGGSGGDEPGDGEVPTGGESKFDTTAMYDGEGHTIDTNALAAAFGTTMIGEFAVEYAVDDGSGANGGPGVPALPWLAEVPAYTNAGEYVVWYRVTNPNYEDFIHAAKVTITKRPVTVTVVGHTATFDYDTTEKSVAGCEATTEDGLYDIAADTAFRGGHAGRVTLPGVVVFDDVTVARTDVGTTAMGLAASDFANSDANFLVTYEVTDGWVKVEPRVIGDDPANWDIRLARNPMYDGTLQTAPITQVAFVKPDGNLDNIPYTLSGNTATDAGNYVVRITGTGNYSGTVEKEWAITPRNVTLTSGGAEWTYDGTAHSETAISVTGDGFADGEGASYSGFPVVRHVSDAATPTANAFAYTLNANTRAQNYVITTANGTVRMTPRAITLTAPTKGKTYDGAALTFTAAEVAATLNGDGGALGDRALPDGESFTFSNFASITEAGRVDATFTVADGTALMNDYAITTVLGTLTVTRNATEITVTAKSGSWTYDGQPHALHEYEATNLGVLQAGDALEVTFSDESVATTPLDGPEGNGVVANVITGVRVLRNGTDDVTANYTLAPYNGTLMVTRRPVTFTSKSDTKVYDGEPLTAHEVTVGGDGFVGEDGAEYTFTGSQTEKGTSKNTFSYTLKSGTNAAYYDITKVEGDLEVTAADISQGDEADWQITLGPALTYTGLEQIQTLASVTYKGLPLDYSVTGNAQTDAGSYTMTLTGQGNFSGTHQVAWSIAPKALTLTAGSGSRVYDGAAFTVGTVTASGFVANEGATYQCTGSQTDVGSSPNEVGTVTWNANTKGSNYAVTKVAGALTVTPRPVTLTAKNITKPYDGTPLALTAGDITADGIVAGESFTYSDFASRTEAGQTPATFSYAAGPGTSLANYAVTVTPGRMITITKSATAISVTAASESWVYDGEAHSNRTWTATNLSTLQAGDELEVTFDEASVVTTPQDGPAQDGVVANVITGVRVIRSSTEDVTANYSVEWFPGTLAVTKRPVTVTVTGHTATYTYDGEEKTVMGYDATTADTLYDIAADTAFSGVATTNRTDAGTSQMGLTAADFTNNDDCFEVTYAVTDGWVKINQLDIAAAGDSFVLLLGANPKYNGTVQTIAIESVTCGGLPVTYTLAGENATHAGTYTLTVKANGNFTGERSTTWQVLKRAVTLTSGGASKIYDGSPVQCADIHVGGDGFIGLEGATFDVTGSQTVAGTSKNTFTYTLKAGTLAGDYAITKVEGDLTVTKASTGGEGGDEPGGGEVPQGGESKFDTTAMYDGEGHTIDTNALTAAFGTAMIGEFAVAYATDDGGGANGGPGAPALPWGTVPVYTNAGEYVVWYRVSNPNYNDFIHAAKVTITNRPVTVTSADGSWTYDGQAHSNTTVTAEGFVDGEGIVASNFATITDVGSAANSFDYSFADGTLAENYAVTCVTGTLTVASAGMDGWTDDAKWSVTLSGDGAKYDGTEKTCEVTALVYDGFAIPTFTVTGNTATDAGDYTLTVTGTGNFSGSHTFPWSIVKREVTLTSGSASKVYDGTALVKHDVAVSGDGFVDGEGAVATYTGSQTAVGSSENTFTYMLKEGTKAGNYTITTVNGSLTVTKASAGGGGGDEPGSGEVPQGGISKFDATVMYDGEGHTIDTNALAVAFGGAVIGEFAVAYAADDGSGANGGPGVPALPWGTVPVYTNVGEYVVWYRVSNPNYEDFIHAAKVTITNRPVTVTSADGSWTYDGQAHSNATVTAEGFVDGEGIVAGGFAEIVDVGTAANAFTYVFADGTLAENYAVTCVTGTLTVVAAGMDGWTDEAKWSVTLSGDGAKYDGTEKTCEVTALAYDGFAIPTFTVTGNTATDAGDYTLTVTGTGNFSGSHTFPWSITKRTVTLTSGDASKVYDGIALTNHTVSVSGDGFIEGESASYNFTGSQTSVGTSENTFTYTLNDGTKADNYDITKVEGNLTVTKASTGGEGGEEPGDGDVPQGGESKFDTTAMYDGEGHTIDTNALVAAFGSAVIGEFAVEYAADDGSANGGPGAPALPWGTVPVYTNAGEYVVWYRVSNPNYNDFIHAAKVTITNRPVTVTSADGSWTYDGQAHSNATVTAEGFVDGEGIVAGGFAEIVDVGTAANAFTYVFADGTLAENYAVTCVTGTLTVAAAGIDGWTDEAKWSVTLSGDGAKYDGTEKTCEVTALAYDGFAIPTFTVAGNTATDAGDYTLTVTGTGNFSGLHTFPWSIVKRAVTLTSGDASKVYDGTPVLSGDVHIAGDGFAASEGASYNFTGSQTGVGTSANAFTYTLNDGTKASNYDITTVNGTLTVTPATLNPTDVFGGDAIETPLVCEKTFNGAAQPVEIVPDFDEPYQFLWALAEGNENAYSATAPTLRNVADGELTVFFKFVTANYELYYGKVVFRILAKELTDEMVVLSDEAFYYDPGCTVKKPSVTVADTNALGEVISTANDYTVAYENATAAGAIPVTVTAKNNYTGTVTKTFPVLKRPVAPPVIGTKAYNGRTQKATITADDRWTVVRNSGGVDVGEYEVVLRLTNTEDYRWKGVDESEAEWTGVFRITKASNGWSRYPGIQSWTNGETPSEPAGQPRYGTLSVAYRRQGADISTETSQKPSMPGKYIARFWAEPTENYIGVAMNSPYEVEFEIYRGPNDTQTETETTPVPVPYTWLDPYLAKYGEGDYETAGKAKGRNGCFLWESYVAGLDPEEPTSKFTAAIELLPNGTVKITWSPDLSNAEVPRTYTTLGKANLTDADWTPVTDANKPQMRFFKVKVEMK